MNPGLLQDSQMSCVVSVHNISWEVMPVFPRGADPAFCQEVTAGNLLPEALEIPHQHTGFAIAASFCIFAPKRGFRPFQGYSDYFSMLLDRIFFKCFLFEVPSVYFLYLPAVE